ncbi:MAG TPA: type VI secretion system tube protein Hcp [Lautropia sp.]|nr:type VI secretion system tube protein Hcp [Lautropia sp.]
MPSASGSACDCFLSLDQVPGEANDGDFPGTIEVIGWNWGASQRGDQVMGSAARAAADVRHFRFEHQVDSATAGLLSRCVTNALIPNATLTQRRAGGSAAQRFLEIKFKQVRIVDVSLVMSDESLIPRETVSFAFESVTLDYTPQAKSGAAQGGRHSFNWIAGTAR